MGAFRAKSVDPPLVLRSGGSRTGRGTLLVAQLADRWGSDALPTGKRVWFELSLVEAPTEPLRLRLA